MKAMPGILLLLGLELKAAPPANWQFLVISPKTPVVVLNLSMTSFGTVANKRSRCSMTFMTCTLMLITLLLITTLPLTISSTMLTNSVFLLNPHISKNICIRDCVGKNSSTRRGLCVNVLKYMVCLRLHRLRVWPYKRCLLYNTRSEIYARLCNFDRKQIHELLSTLDIEPKQI